MEQELSGVREGEEEKKGRGRERGGEHGRGEKEEKGVRRGGGVELIHHQMLQLSCSFQGSIQPGGPIAGYRLLVSRLVPPAELRRGAQRA